MTKTTLLNLLFFGLLISLPASSQENKKDERWFEIEVILFSQLSDKSQLKEEFPETVLTPKQTMRGSRRALDLLKEYIQPDLTNIKTLLPGCFEDHTQFDLFAVASKEPEFVYSERLVLEPQLDFDHGEELTPNDAFAQMQKQTEINQIIADNNELLEKRTPLFQVKNSTNRLLSLERLGCLLPGDNYNWQQQLSLEASNLDDIDTQFIPVAKMPARIHGSEPLDSNSAYLISSDSLQLKKIAQKLRNSKNFRPLLHLGWRQVGLPKNQAKPVHLYAGDNLALHYQLEQDKYQQLIAQSDKLVLTEEEQQTIEEQQVAAQIQTLISDFEQNNFTREQLIESAESQEQSSAINTLIDNEKLMAPKPPKQNWQLDGLFKVHLNHYLFITADMSIMEKSLDNVSYDPLVDKQIRFRQNRRVISGQVHYFDHPYMGIVVQIRRYAKPDPITEQNVLQE